MGEWGGKEVNFWWGGVVWWTRSETLELNPEDQSVERRGGGILRVGYGGGGRFRDAVAGGGSRSSGEGKDLDR